VENKRFGPPSTSPTGMNLGVGMVVWRIEKEAAVLGSSFLEVGGLKRSLVRQTSCSCVRYESRDRFPGVVR
jgi:hypothetical protein